MIVLDAGVLIGLLDSHDAHHEPAVRVMMSADGPFMMHSLTLAEVLVGPARKGLGREAWLDIADIGVRVADLGDDEPLLLARVRVDHGLKMPDTCVLATAIHLGAQVVTFDQRLARVAGGLGLLRTDAGA